ncbi:MAG: helix-hairpin-helix domain-containing protein [Acidimicrobiales bacterium]
MGHMNHEGQGRALVDRLPQWRSRFMEWLRFLGWRRVAASVVATVSTAAVLLWMFVPSPAPVDTAIPVATATQSPTPPPAAVTVRVHVTGAVRRPGVYELSSGDRVVDALEAAGGASADADLEAINLAQTLLDTEQILVPRRTAHSPRRAPAPRLRPSPRPRTVPTTVPPVPPAATSVPVPSGEPTPGTSVPATKININSATATELDTLPGIGPTTARAIIDHRRTKGPFRKVEDLMNVAGIGPTRFARIKPLVTV